MHEISKYQTALNNHPFTLSDEEVSKRVRAILSEKRAENDNQKVYRELYSCIDMTTLNSTDTRDHVWKFTQKVNDFEGSNAEVENVAAICVYPNFVKTVKEALTADVKIASVCAGFPSSQTFSEIKTVETALAVADGADEIDIVINLGLFLSDDYEELCEELIEIKEACHEAKLKIILETGALQSAEKIHKASVLSLYSGADFLKTSTGKVYSGATPEAAYVMCLAIKSYFKKTGFKAGIKIAGGVASVEDAVTYYTLVREVLGNEWCHKDLFRIGASRLADTLLKAIG
ncbi:MAG TPA: deoxyribose-phosphate aldolase [Porphyromonadaceae bacterium]|jgi:deoxyribose-phosphate aldolase|nr:deoxyribose-phosphate aldolase [Porphyromonadaceae bacterium]HBL34935.1 deoxyribose-phosphate aldolase [Porphyromonadaceae bacterium]